MHVRVSVCIDVGVGIGVGVFVVMYSSVCHVRICEYVGVCMYM